MNIQNFFSTYFSNHNQNIEDTFISLIKQTKIEIIYKIFTNTFYNYYMAKLNYFFQNLISKNILFCNLCQNNPSSSYSVKECIELHNNQGISSSFEILFQFFEDMINTEQLINEKFDTYFKKKILNFKLSKEIAYLFITQIGQLLKLKMYLLFEKYKLELNLNDSLIYLPQNIRQIIFNLNLYELYQDIISKFIIKEIITSIIPYKNIHNQNIINNIIDKFNNHYLIWGYKNITNSDTSSKSLSNSPLININEENYKNQFINLLKQKFVSLKIENFFEIISKFPDSKPTLIDIKICISSFDKNIFVSRIKDQLQKRLLYPGVSTRIIIEIFIRIIKIMRIIDSSSNYMLELLSQPIKEYLLNRKDTIQWIITAIISEEDVNMIEDMSKAYVKNIQSKDYDYLSSDDEPENWEPINLKGIKYNDKYISNDFKNTKIDIVSILVNVFGSPEKFMEQYKRMLIERKITDNNFELEQEIKNLELLKLKFGENLLTNCEIIIQHIKESKKINNKLFKDPNFTCLIINSNYWPFIKSNHFDLSYLDEPNDKNINDKNNNNIINTSEEKIPYDKFLDNFNNKLKHYQKLYSDSKFSRNIDFYTNLGYCHITLSFKNGNFDFVVSPLSYLIIQFFDEDNKKNFKNFNIDYITNKLHSELLLVKQSLDFWISKGVLKKIKKENNDDNSDNNYYYEPNDILNVGDEHEIIIEEKIYNFEYPKDISNSLLIENSIMSIIRNGGPKNFEQLYKNLIYSYKLDISEIKLKDLLWKMTLEQKICKDSENYKLIVVN
jgi:anaphase-promoting complex subunit 2